jgi:hypothetical protein
MLLRDLSAAAEASFTNFFRQRKLRVRNSGLNCTLRSTLDISMKNDLMARAVEVAKIIGGLRASVAKQRSNKS